MAALAAAHFLEVLGLLYGATVLLRFARAHPGHGAGLPTLLLLIAAAAVGWQATRLLAGRRRLTVTGLAVHSAILIGAIALATQRPAAGLAGVVVAGGALAAWGRLGRPEASMEPSAASQARPAQSGSSARPALTGTVLVLLTSALVLAALSVRSGIVVGIVVLAVIFVPLERLFALHPRRVLRAGWRTDLVHYLVNGAALNVGIVVAVAVGGTVLRAFVPPPFRAAIAASPGWAQIAAGLAIATVGSYAGHRAAHEVPLLWRFHRVHHSIREMDWLAASHLHPLDQIFMRSTAVLPLYALGFGRLGLGAFVVLLTLQAIFIHANVRLTFGPLRWVIATPQFHHWHHAREPRAYNSNYAGEFPALDALFGTLYFPVGRWPAEYGIDATEPQGYVRQLLWPLAGSRG